MCCIKKNPNITENTPQIPSLWKCWLQSAGPVLHVKKPLKSLMFSYAYKAALQKIHLGFLDFKRLGLEGVATPPQACRQTSVRQWWFYLFQETFTPSRLNFTKSKTTSPKFYWPASIKSFPEIYKAFKLVSRPWSLSVPVGSWFRFLTCIPTFFRKHFLKTFLQSGEGARTRCAKARSTSGVAVSSQGPMWTFVGSIPCSRAPWRRSEGVLAIPLLVVAPLWNSIQEPSTSQRSYHHNLLNHNLSTSNQ